MFIVKLALKSLLNRKFTVALTIFSIAISITLLLGVERIRIGLENSFTNTISGTDLVVGARTGDEQLLLSTVFHIGTASNNISWHSYEDIAANELIDWTIPISLGDSHEGFSVIGTNHDYFTHYQFANKQQLQFQDGKAFDETFIDASGANISRQVFNWILAGGLKKWSKLILEYPDKNGIPRWLHIGYDKENLNNQVLVVDKENPNGINYFTSKYSK